MTIEFSSIHTKDDLEHIGILSKIDSPKDPEECFLLINRKIWRSRLRRS